jgi:hypothetical protein
MSKFYGKIGFSTLNETVPGVYEEVINERTCFGDLIRNTRRLQNSTSVNDNINISNEISIVADPYTIQNFHAIRYIRFMGSNWKVSTVEVQYPRLILTLGGIYNG